MCVVSDTSPLSNLAIIDRLGLLRVRYGRVTIPSMVRRELRDLRHKKAQDGLRTAFEIAPLGF